MKKMMLLGMCLFGMSQFANAWMTYTPQSWAEGSENTRIVTCHNTSSDPCMAGGGDNPKVGQTVAIFDQHGIIGWGTVVECLAYPEMTREGNAPIGQPTVLEIAFDAE